jgi:trehalose-phosphatase
MTAGSGTEACRAAVTALARTDRLLVCSDFDGTLAPIVDDPTAARALPAGAEALTVLAALPHTTAAVSSGRALADLVDRTGLTDPVRQVGSHGAEFDVGRLDALAGPTRARFATVVTTVREIAEGVLGVQVEQQPASVAVHVRRADRATARQVLDRLRAAVAELPGVHMTEGHEVLELSALELNKGTAILALREQSAAAATLFIGDDVTDERGFEVLDGPDVGVKVGPGPTSAGYRLDSPLEVADLLATSRRSERNG